MINVSTIQLFYYYKLCKLVVQGYFSNILQINMYVIVLMVINMGQMRCKWYEHQCWISWTVTKQSQIMEMQSKWIKGWLKEKRLKVRIQIICWVDHCFEIFLVLRTNNYISSMNSISSSLSDFMSLFLTRV